MTWHWPLWGWGRPAPWPRTSAGDRSRTYNSRRPPLSQTSPGPGGTSGSAVCPPLQRTGFVNIPVHKCMTTMKKHRYCKLFHIFRCFVKFSITKNICKVFTCKSSYAIIIQCGTFLSSIFGISEIIFRYHVNNDSIL